MVGTLYPSLLSVIQKVLGPNGVSQMGLKLFKSLKFLKQTAERFQ
ncbi:unnamed protein product [Callosobruchus maculatus]|uniref:Uncharacterized protein n=1 Tax=Callosobruchus maculatus TaxID=64391 RepID=A0A653DZT0_CALMS|nr:unnamed protein product [Callosobruchus maculatus]